MIHITLWFMNRLNEKFSLLFFDSLNRDLLQMRLKGMSSDAFYIPVYELAQ